MKSISKSCRLIKILVFGVIIFSLAMTSIDVFAAYSSDWKSWTQSGSNNSNVKQYGCRVVAFAKIIYESGWADFSNPDEYFNTGVQNGWFQSGVTENGSFGNALSSYISSRGGTCSKIREISLNQNATSYSNDIMDYVRSGYYITLSCSSHTAYISPSASVAAGKPVVYDSGKSTSTSLIHDLGNKANTGSYWTKLRVWQIPAGGMSGTDNMMPSIQNVKVVERYKNGFKMQCFVSDNVGVAKVQFPTWESSKTSEGCTWYAGTHIGNGIWEFDFKDASVEGYYTTHIYAWDTTGNSTCVGTETYVDRTPPTVSEMQVTDVTTEGYKVSVKVADNCGIDRVDFPSWTDYNGQDDIQSNQSGKDCGNGVYEYFVKRADHNEEFGHYTTHIYVYDTSGNSTFGGGPVVILENVAPTFSEVKISDQTEEGYTVTCKATDESGIGKIDICVWTRTNGQDDLVIGNGECIGNDAYSYRVKYTDHNNEFGEYITHVYAYDTLGNSVFCGEFEVENKESGSKNPSGPSNPGEPSAPNDPSEPSNPSVPSTPDVSDQTNVDNSVAAVGTVVIYDGLKYKVTKAGKEVACIKLEKNSYSTVIIPSMIIHNGVTYKVTSIAKNAFKNNKKITSVTIGKNVTTIGKNAFYGCSKLKTLKIKTSKLASKKIGSKAFSKTPKSMKVTLLKKKYKTYKSMLIKKGVNKKAKFKKG